MPCYAVYAGKIFVKLAEGDFVSTNAFWKWDSFHDEILIMWQDK